MSIRLSVGQGKRHQPGVTLVDMIISGSASPPKLPRIGVTPHYTFRSPRHLIAYTKSDVYKELTQGYDQRQPHRCPPRTRGTRQTASNRAVPSAPRMKRLEDPGTETAAALPGHAAPTLWHNTAPIAFAEGLPGLARTAQWKRKDP